VSDPLLVRALRREPVERTPVWFMRQAGRSLPEYRALRERHSFFEVANTPELCAEVTLQPVRRHRVDAAVLFADIVTPVLGMGLEVELVEGVGPVVPQPIATMADVERLQVPDAQVSFQAVIEAVRIIRDELESERALVGFCGGPFTVAGYLVEGRPSRDFVKTKELMYREPQLWHGLMDKLTESFAGYLREQADAGAGAIQIFDSWVGVLSVADYEEFVAPYSTRLLAGIRVPTIHFGTGAAHLLTAMAAAGGDAIGLDWRVPLDEGWLAVGPDRAVQGNLDPAALLAPWPRIEAAAADVLARAGGRPGHVFNLGHGVLPATDPADLSRLVEFVHERTARAVT
jgi:uroporphyrinogen decarboxylase